MKEKIEKLYARKNKDYADAHRYRNPMSVIRFYQGQQFAIAEVLGLIKRNPTITRDEIFEYIESRIKAFKKRPDYQREHQIMDDGYCKGYKAVVRVLLTTGER